MDTHELALKRRSIPHPAVEPLLTITEAANQLGLTYYMVQRAVRAGTVSAYTFYNNRKRMRMSDLLAIIEGSRGATAVEG